jgi:anti-anti-sigma regulatory factor
MSIKTSTKEKFIVFTPETAALTDNITAELINQIHSCQKTAIPHVVLNLCNVTSIDNQSAQNIAIQQQQFYEKSFSYVICCLTKTVTDTFENLELLELLNVTPTESEAWDIVQMEEIERELLDGLE